MTPSHKERFTVYEIINEQRHEIFVGSTSLPIFELIAELGRKPPALIKHWDLSDATSVRSVEFDLEPAAARAFIAEYVQSGLPNGWRYLAET